MKSYNQIIAVAVLGAFANTANAALVLIGPGAFTPQATAINFGEVALGSVNPHYSLATTSLGTVDVDFDGYFVGQSAVGGAVVTLGDNTPTSGVALALDPASPNTFTSNDGAPGATSPVLSGSPIFNGPISVLFSKNVAAVGLKGGFFDSVASTSIEAYDALGNSLGIVQNTATGFNFFGLADSSGAAVIRGISFYITGPENAGFAIDNLTFGSGAEVTIPGGPGVPEASTVAAGIALAGLVGGTWLRRRTRAQA
jgi:hypothetical protein